MNSGIEWLEWVKRIQAIAQTGLAYSKDVYDLERYEELRELSIEILENYTSVSADQIKLHFGSETGYATPKVDIRGVVFQNDKILLVREKADNAWALPGGWADIGYSPSEVVVKEIEEESGYITTPKRVLAVLDKKFHNHPPEQYHVYKMFIQCEIAAGEPKGGVETLEVGFFNREEIPTLSLERNTPAQIQTMFQFLDNPQKTTIID
ncbi:NUDIX hydrolase [Paenibacillus pabuli]|uniref:NUDIX hydrolase n=1 Tax=Paenibacillus pabuli TaxID=1472 RepID=UPI00200000FB|nr:NUDIX hydrolase [Paenibacillus pabuli]UPK41607.1 NUDIX hydrolase [Paenibacillus pabuli]